MKFSPMAIVACMLCVGILALGLNSPQQSRLDADEIAQKKSDISATEQMARDLMESLKNQQSLSQKLTEADNRTIEVIANLQESIARLGEHVRDSVPTREEVTRLVSTKSEFVASSDGECTCGEKLSDLQKQIDDLKAKVATLECQCATSTTAKPASAAAAASSYGTVTSSPVVVTSSGGSTGSSVRSSGGSTGSVVRSTVSYGSTGSSVQYSQPVTSQPVTSSVRYSAGPSPPGHWTYPGSIDSHLQTEHGVSVSGMSRSQMLNLHDSLHEGTATASTVVTSAPVVVSPASNCPNGQCPTSASRSSVNQTFFPRLRNRFGN